VIACPPPERLAAAAAGEDGAALDHAGGCPACAAILAEQCAIVGVAAQLPTPTLAEARRRQLAAEVLAHADEIHLAEMDIVQRRGNMMALCALAAVAAALVLLLGARHQRAWAPVVAMPAEEALTLEVVDRTTAPEDRAPETETADGLHDVLELHDGELAIDTRAHKPVTVVAGGTRVRIAKSRATVVARGGVIVTAQVFAGTAEISEGGHRRVVEAGEVWTPSPAVTALGSFRTGYEAMRAGHFTDAIAAFDQATDPVVIEDAQFWAAISCERAGRREEAERRLRAFIAAFPSSPRLEDARAAIDRVTSGQ
jgi:TolA-binding protein